jgi:predicted transcriptional regulator of viral defense system
MLTLQKWLYNNVSEERYIFLSSDLKALFPALSDGAFKTLLSRSAHKGVLEKICRNVYGFNIHEYSKGRLLFHVASHLRSEDFNYISLESVLSDAGIISQIPQNRSFIMSTGRSQIMNCGSYGIIEYIHTKTNFDKIVKDLTYDTANRLWRASVELAIKDMKKTKRNCDLINGER